MDNEKAKNLVTFWFSERVEKLWYNSTPEFDKELEQKFSSLYQDARDEKLNDWKTTATGCLALIIVFDQYPLNVYRNNKQSFATEKVAIEIAEHCIKQGFDKKLSNTQRSFVYLPFMHSEDIAHQKRSIELFRDLDPDNFTYAQHHHDIVEQYGRFPHRNSILKRVSTPAELDYLSSKEAFTG
ncbi:MAG: DUF924 family protein [Gammaproteobacteria bacterium]